ncbi:sodium:proton antiporter [Filobacillus milosensis]|uniref:Sodium:proton antiporter n=1 Tax=Filobacillus milosensis TaxID=94137 RepID=A0A4Y8IIT3_9BACI|nr:cation:proton antiporter [Filobacillus milosensis]TFB19592.1 sodium:proton antiporter [Filobacillus milosensis]
MVHEFNDVFMQILILLTISVAVAILASKFKQPYSIALVVVGLVIGLMHLPGIEEAQKFITQSAVFQVVIISIFLPTLLGEATLNLPFSDLKENKKPILALAFVGTFISSLVIGSGIYFLLDLPLVVAFTFGALMSATDPISVLSIFKSLGVTKKLTTIIEGESLFNDGIAVVLFTIASVYLLDYIDMGWAGLGEGVLLFVKFAIGGLLIGAAFGLLASRAVSVIDNYPMEITLSMLLFFGSYFTAELIHVSGVIAVVISGLVFGNYGGKIGMSPVTKLSIHTFWSVVAFIANSIIFLMVGLEINQIDLSGKWGMVLLGILIVIGARAIATYTSLALIKGFPMKFRHALNWGGLKGSLSIALALSLPTDFDGREDILVLTLSVVLFSLIVQGLTIKPLIKKVGILQGDEGVKEYEEVVTTIYRYETAIQDWEDMQNKSFITRAELDELKKEYQDKLDDYYAKLDDLYDQYPEIKVKHIRSAKRDALYVEYQSVKELVRREIITDDVGSKHMSEILEKIEDIETKMNTEH